jgi:hypothetical protein
MSLHERKTSIREFYDVLFPSLLQLHGGITDVEERKQKEICDKRYRKKDRTDKGKMSEIDLEREEECGICLEIRNKVVLPTCNHSMCINCYRNWYIKLFLLFTHSHHSSAFFLQVIESLVWNRRARSQSCPFCRGSLKRVNSGDLWIYTCSAEIADLPAIYKENLKRLLIYIDKLPLVTSDPNLVPYAPLPR